MLAMVCSLTDERYLSQRELSVPKSIEEYAGNLVAIDGTVLREMQQSNARLNIIILDACRDHPPLPSNPSRGGSGRSRLGRDEY